MSKHGLPSGLGRTGIAVATSDPARVYALIDARQGGLYRSDDRGANWVRVNTDSRIWGRGWYFGGITVDPTNADVIYICNTAMYRSGDGGKTFVPVKGAPGGDDYHQLWIDPTHPERQILGVDQGAVVTLDGGGTWSSWYNQPTGQFYHVATDERFPYWVYGAQQDSGAAGVPSRTDNIDGINLRQFHESAPGGESDNVAPDPDDPQLIFGGRVDRLDLRSGQTQSVDPVLAHPGLYRGAWTLPLVFGKAAQTGRGHTLYFGNQRIFRSADRGDHWQPISPDLSRELPAAPPNLDAATLADDEHGSARRGVVYAIGPSPLRADVLWAGTDDGLVWRTADGGAHWRNVTPPGVTAWSKIAAIEASHFDVDSAYVAVDRHRLDDSRPYIYRTHDGGAHWNLIGKGIGGSGAGIRAVNVVREDPLQRGLLYSGSEHGVDVSFDDGNHWQSLQLNLPRTAVRDLQVHGSDLVIATHGRGFWILDDVALLRSLTENAAQTTRLLPPAPAYRVRPTGFTGTPFPKDEPRGENPPAGAYIDYVLDSGVPGEIAISISDASGQRVRRFSSRDASLPPSLSKLTIAPEWVVTESALPVESGAHRLVWDLHYQAPAALKPADNSDPDAEENGVWAAPGFYTVELKVGDRVFRQPLQILADPRAPVPVAAAHYAHQLALARQIEAARVQIATALVEARRAHAAIAAQINTGNADAQRLLAADAQLLGIADLLPEKPGPDFTGLAPRSEQGLRHLADVFRALALAVDGADAAPTADAERGFAKERVVLDRTLAQWAQFKRDQAASLGLPAAAGTLPP